MENYSLRQGRFTYNEAFNFIEILTDPFKIHLDFEKCGSFYLNNGSYSEIKKRKLTEIKVLKRILRQKKNSKFLKFKKFREKGKRKLNEIKCGNS